MFHVHNSHAWAEVVFGNATLNDARRTLRLVRFAALLARYSGSSAARACEGNHAMLTGAYRFIRNDAVSATMIRKAGFEATAKASEEIKELLALEDTTSLSYKHEVAKELGKLGKVNDKSRGWWVHSVLLVNSLTLQTVGLIHQEWWLRPDKAENADEKESGKWQDAAEFTAKQMTFQMPKVIAVCDREADIYDYLTYKTEHEERFVVRAKHNRKMLASDSRLFDTLKTQPLAGDYMLDIPQKTLKNKNGKKINRPTRKAKIAVQYTEVTLPKGNLSITLNAVFASEVSGSQDKLSWMLLTSEPVGTFNEALKIIHIYMARWRVEDFHKAWKTGAGVERQRMESTDNLERMGSILAFVGVRLMQLRESFTLPIFLKKLGLLAYAKQVEEMPCDQILTEYEWKVLSLMKPNKFRNKGTVPSLGWAYIAIAKLGGFSDSKRTGLASWETLWKGWQILQERAEGFKMAKDLDM